MSEEMMINGHITKLFAIACILFGLSCIGVTYTIHDQWKKRQIRKENEKLQDEWMEENAARLDQSELPW